MQAAQIRPTLAAGFAVVAALLFTPMPVCTVKLQQSGSGHGLSLKVRGATAAILTIPMMALLVALESPSVGCAGS